MKDTWEGLQGFCILMLCLIINLAGAFSVLVVLHYQEHINPELCIAALAVYCYITMMTIVVAVNRA